MPGYTNVINLAAGGRAGEVQGQTPPCAAHDRNHTCIRIRLRTTDSSTIHTTHIMRVFRMSINKNHSIIAHAQ